jgi:quercetin dioxygenase-like cupin family protein
MINMFIKKTKNKNMSNYKSLTNVEPIEMLEGIVRRTLCFNDDLMLCHFNLRKDSEIPLHQHEQHQVGYVIKGMIRFFTKDREFIAKKGDSYLFESNESHGAKILEDAEVLDIFNPSRVDYM